MIPQEVARKIVFGEKLSKKDLLLLIIENSTDEEIDEICKQVKINIDKIGK